jgi:hypothetical protein
MQKINVKTKTLVDMEALVDKLSAKPISGGCGCGKSTTTTVRETPKKNIKTKFL